VSKKVRIGVVVGIGVGVAAGIAGGFLAATTRAATHGQGAAPKTYKVTAKLAAKTGSGKGTFTGTLTRSTTTSGKLVWKLVYSGASGPVTATQVRLRATPLVKLCGPCPSGSHKTTALRTASLAAIIGGKATLTAATKAHPLGELVGKLKATLVPSGGGGVVVPVTPALVAAGKKASEEFSCEGCHTTNGTKSTGPTWKGLAGSKQKLTDGTTAIATDSYLIGIITDPSTAKVEGYDSGVMAEAIAPGQVSDAQARAIVAYIKTLK
jgi:mono/diheme cytochrome c family protein